jgi:hypothetical protein
LNGVSLTCSEMTCPNPLFGICEVGKLPRFPTPLTGLTTLLAEQVSKSRK